MAEATGQELKLLYCYAPEDRQWPEIIDAQLQDLKRQHQIISRFDGELAPNPDQKARLHTLIKDIDMVLLLVSPHFQAVESFWQELCLESGKISWIRRLGGCRVVAFVLEPVAWNHAPAEAREILPREGVPPRAEQIEQPVNPLTAFPNDVKPLSLWPDQEQAFDQIARWLHMTIEQLWAAKGYALRDMGGSRMAHEALAAYEEALRLNPLLTDAWDGKAAILIELRRYEEALEKWLSHHPARKDPRTGKPPVLIGPKLYEEALEAIEEELRLDPTYLWAWEKKADVLACLKHYEEALQAVDVFLQGQPPYHHQAGHTKAHALAGLNRYEEALQAIDVFLQGHPANGSAWHEKSEILKAMGRSREASQAKKKARQFGYPF